MAEHALELSQLWLSDHSSSSESPREQRVRRAIEHAKQHYVPVHEDRSWFIPPTLTHALGAAIAQTDTDTDDHWTDAARIQPSQPALDALITHALRTDRRATNKLDWTLSALYAHSCTRAALTLALALLRTTGCTLDTHHTGHDLSTAYETPLPIAPIRTRGKARANEPYFAFEKEAIDVALRASVRLLTHSDGAAEDSEQIRKSARSLALHTLSTLPHDRLRETLWDGTAEIPTGWQRVHWTSTPGIALSLGRLCTLLHEWRAASLAYALYTGTRGPLRATSRHTATALAHYALTLPAGEARSAYIDLSHAFAASFLGATPPGARRRAAIEEVRQGHLVPLDLLPSPSPHPLEEADTDNTSTEDTLRVLLHAFRDSPSTTAAPLPPECVIALVRCGPARKTPLSVCVHRLRLFLDAGGDEGEGEDDVDGRVQVRSVRTL